MDRTKCWDGVGFGINGLAECRVGDGVGEVDFVDVVILWMGDVGW